MPDEVPDFVEVEIEAEPVFADCLKDAHELEPGDDKGVAALMAKAAQARLSDVQVEMLLKATSKATKVGIKVLRQEWAKALAAYVRAKNAAEAPECEARAAKAETELQREVLNERKRLEASCRRIAESQTLLKDFEEAVHAAGVVGEGAAIRGAYLAGTSRLLVSKAISLLRRGAAAGGKNVLLSAVFSFFPDEDVIHMSSGSPMSLVYYGGGDEDALKHKILYIQEAVILADKHGVESPLTVMVRALISEGHVDHHVAIPQGKGPPADEHIRRNGPTVVVLTSARDNIESELLTRLLTSDADESRGQTMKVVERLWSDEDPRPTDREAWVNFQRLLARDAPYHVSVPFGEAMYAALKEWTKALPSTMQLRLRRDASGLLSAIKASAVIHKAQRQSDARRRIVATLDDYTHAYEAFDAGISSLYGLKPIPAVVAVVRAIEGMGAKKGGESIKVTVSALRAKLGVNSNDVANRRLWEAVDHGFLKFDDAKSGQGRGKPNWFELLITAQEIETDRPRGVFPSPELVASVCQRGPPYCGTGGYEGQNGQNDRNPGKPPRSDDVLSVREWTGEQESERESEPDDVLSEPERTEQPQKTAVSDDLSVLSGLSVHPAIRETTLTNRNLVDAIATYREWHGPPDKLLTAIGQPADKERDEAAMIARLNEIKSALAERGIAMEISGGYVTLTRIEQKSGNPNGLTVGKPESLEVAPATPVVWVQVSDRRWRKFAQRWHIEKGTPLRAATSAHANGAGAFVPTSWLARG
jgi:hypothetical protein